mgnify:FL=1
MYLNGWLAGSSFYLTRMPYDVSITLIECIIGCCIALISIYLLWREF